MKSYPSIPNYSILEPHILFHTFRKRDGSNLRMEWSKKRGWYKFGSRRRLIDETTPILGSAIPLFMETLSEDISRILVDKKLERAILFCEYWGLNSFAGRHIPGERKYLSPIDLSVYKKGLVDPSDFVKMFKKYIEREYLGMFIWDSAFIGRARALTPLEGEGLQCEGFVAKTGQGTKRKMFKFKTQWWYDKVCKTFDKSKALEICSS